MAHSSICIIPQFFSLNLDCVSSLMKLLWLTTTTSSSGNSIRNALNASTLARISATGSSSTAAPPRTFAPFFPLNHHSFGGHREKSTPGNSSANSATALPTSQLVSTASEHRADARIRTAEESNNPVAVSNARVSGLEITSVVREARSRNWGLRCRVSTWSRPRGLRRASKRRGSLHLVKVSQVRRRFAQALYSLSPWRMSTILFRTGTSLIRIEEFVFDVYFSPCRD